jgi:prepilin-type N-terminal cleavage/methylation domain-containing protein
MHRVRGFTLVEIAIVILVASLLLAAVLKGNSVLRDAKIQDAVAIAQDLSAAVNQFKQRYHMFPGDFPINTATPEISGVSALCMTGAQKGDGNGLIDTGGNAAGSLGVPAEVQCVPEVLFKAGLVGSVDSDSGVSVFKAKFGGRVWVRVVNTSNVVTALVAAGIPIPFPASTTHVIEFENLPCSAAHDMDRKIDDDNLQLGKGAASTPLCAGDALVFYAIAL